MTKPTPICVIYERDIMQIPVATYLVTPAFDPPLLIEGEATVIMTAPLVPSHSIFTNASANRAMSCRNLGYVSVKRIWFT